MVHEIDLEAADIDGPNSIRLQGCDMRFRRSEATKDVSFPRSVDCPRPCNSATRNLATALDLPDGDKQAWRKPPLSFCSSGSILTGSILCLGGRLQAMAEGGTSNGNAEC
ncbi:hypothetical protein GCM10011504_57420 [Siccirubricoccus deserti]|nr:hypothetical protein GCM10011504_57420 [Siccirubricoccus deserti]